MDFYAVELPCRAETVVVDDLAVPDVHARDTLHFLCGQFKIKDIHIFQHPLLVDSLGDGRDAPLEMPPENDLRGCFSVFFSNFGQYFVAENIALPFGERPPGLGDHAVILHDPQGGVLLEERVDLDLIHHRLDLLVHA